MRGTRHFFGGVFLATIVLISFVMRNTALPTERRPAATAAGFEIDLGNSRTIPDDLSELNSVLTEARERFEKIFGPITQKIRFAIDPLECFRTGYKFSSGAIQFCAVDGIKDFGLHSKSVIRHEAFHAFLCQLRSEICTADKIKLPEVEALHEGLADFFAYQFEAPNLCFGEGFYSDMPCIRNYRTDLCYALTEGAHGRGSSIASALIEKKITMEQLSAAITSADFSVESVFFKLGITEPCFQNATAPRIEIKVENYLPSRLHKYWLERERPLILAFFANETLKKLYPDLKISVLQKTGEPSDLFKVICDQPSLRCRIEAGEQEGTEVLQAQFFNAGKVVGTATLYLGTR